MTFGKLVLKEIKGSRLTAVIFAVLVVLWHFFLLTRTAVWGAEVIPLAAMPFFLPPLWVFGTMLYMLHTEWNTHSIYLLLSLPVRGWYILGAKLVAALVDLLILGAVALASFWLTFGRALTVMLREFAAGIPYPWLISLALKIFLVYLLSVIVVLVVGQFSYLSSRLVSRFSGVLMGAAFFVQLWLLVRLGALLSPLFKWVPDLAFRDWTERGGVIQVNTTVIDTAPIAAVLFLTAAIFLFGSWLLENEIEV